MKRVIGILEPSVKRNREGKGSSTSTLPIIKGVKQQHQDSLGNEGIAVPGSGFAPWRVAPFSGGRPEIYDLARTRIRTCGRESAGVHQRWLAGAWWGPLGKRINISVLAHGFAFESSRTVPSQRKPGTGLTATTLGSLAIVSTVTCNLREMAAGDTRHQPGCQRAPAQPPPSMPRQADQALGDTSITRIRRLLQGGVSPHAVFHQNVWVFRLTGCQTRGDCADYVISAELSVGSGLLQDRQPVVKTRRRGLRGSNRNTV